jgi:hypothetical protein
MKHLRLTLLCLGILYTVIGCSDGFSPSLSGTLTPYWTLRPQEPSHGPAYAREMAQDVAHDQQRRRADER